jgi:type II secretory pathway component PulF
MAAFGYTAINASGVELQGEISAPDAPAAREALRVRGLLALEVREKAASTEGIRGAASSRP